MAPIDPAHLVGTGGALGALARYSLARRIDRRDEWAFPVGTLTVNVLGSVVLGLVTFASPPPSVVALVGIGACGSFTTFSSFAFGTVRLWEDGERGRAVANALLSLLGALFGVGLAWLVVELVGSG